MASGTKKTMPPVGRGPQGKKKRVKKRKPMVEDRYVTPEFPWERQQSESAAAFKAFVVYRDLGEKRTIRATCEALDVWKSRVSQWSAPSPLGNDWVKRTKAYDMYCDKLKRMASEDAIVKMSERHASNALALTSAAMGTLMKYVRTSANPDPSTMTDTNAIRLFEVGVKVERQARGEPDSIVQQTSEVGITVESSDEKRKRMLKLLEHPEGAKHMAEISRLLGDDNGASKGS